MSQELKERIGRRILSEANDLKRTVSSLAQEIEIEESHLQNVLTGNCSLEETHEIIRLMGQYYPISVADLLFDEDDCVNRIRIMRAEESEASSRVFARKDSNGEATPYYEYRDTAMSKLGPFKPEWIKELRVVDNADPENPDVAYNNGHFLHQITFMVGPVNFYWEVNGKKYCREMNTGDSNYITPFWPHSFTSRDPNETALILAVTYGGDVRRSQKELYMLGDEGIRHFSLDYRDHKKATTQLIRQHMANENLTADNLQFLLDTKGIDLDAQALLDEKREKSTDDLRKLATCLEIEVNDLLIPEYRQEDEVVVRHRKDQIGYTYPSESHAQYRIHPLAQCSKMPLMKGSDIEVLSPECTLDNAFISSLHTYVYNYGETAVQFHWQADGQVFKDRLHPGDSAYVQPFVRYAFANTNEDNGNVLTIRVSGSVNFATQKELSYFADIDRIIESKCWFD